jgi:ATP-dependent Zn protease
MTIIEILMAIKFLYAYMPTYFNIPKYYDIQSKEIREKEKSSSITIEVFFKQTNDTIAHSLLDYITTRPNIKNILYTNHIFKLNHKLPILINNEEDIYICLLKDNSQDQDNMSQIIEIYSYTLNIEELRSFIKKIEYNYIIKIQNKLGDKLYYFNDISTGKINKNDYNKLPPTISFTMKPFITNRTFKNVIGPESKLIEKRVNFFKHNKKWYDNKGIPYTLGLLLSGPPGGGKTSTIKCVANEMQRHIINVKLHKYITRTQMENLFFNDVINVVQNGKTEQFIIPINNRIYVFEDIDCQENDIVLERKDIEKPRDEENVFIEKLSLSCLLNILDGILETPGRIIVMTTNYPELLDKALIRPGRIDLICQFTKCTNEMIIEFIETFYDIILTYEDIQKIMELENYKYTPAELTKILFENFDNNLKAIEYITL